MNFDSHEVVERAVGSQPSVHAAVVDGLHVATVGDRTAPRQTLMFMGIDSCIEPFELQRFSLLSALWDTQLTVVDTPGYGTGGKRLTVAQCRGLYRGDFALVARQMVRAAQAHNPRLRADPAVLVGYSMGASVAAAAAADPGLQYVSHMILVEPVGIRRWRLPHLLLSLITEGRVEGRYFDNNSAFPSAVQPLARRDDRSPPRTRSDLAQLGLAVGRGRIEADLMRAKDVQDFDVQVVHGVASRLSPDAQVRSLVARCQRSGLAIRDVPVRGHHALWQSLPDVAALAQLTRIGMSG